MSNKLSVSYAALKDAFGFTSIASHRKKDTPLQYMRLVVNESQFNLYHCDGYRACRYQAVVGCGEDVEIDELVHPSTLKRVISAPGIDKEKDIKIAVDDEVVEFAVEGKSDAYDEFTLRSKRVASHKIDVPSIFNAKPFTFHVSRLALLSSFNDDESFVLTINEDGKAISVNDTEISIECKTGLFDASVTLNSKYLIDALLHFDTAKISIGVPMSGNEAIHINPVGNAALSYTVAPIGYK